MPKECTIPLEWQDFDEVEYDAIEFCDVTFYADFGPWKAGDKFATVYVNYSEGYIVCDESTPVFWVATPKEAQS